MGAASGDTVVTVFWRTALPSLLSLGVQCRFGNPASGAA
jgi:hypothetical protein